MSRHDRLCPLVKLTVLQSGCPRCDLIHASRQSTYKDVLAAIHYDFPKPTLGVKKIIAMLEARIHD